MFHFRKVELQLASRKLELAVAAENLSSTGRRFSLAEDGVAVMREQGQGYAPQLPEVEAARVAARSQAVRRLNALFCR